MLTLPNIQGYGGSSSVTEFNPTSELDDVCTVSRWRGVLRETISLHEIAQPNSLEGTVVKGRLEQ